MERLPRSLVCKQRRRCVWPNSRYWVSHVCCRQQFCFLPTTERVTASVVSCRLKEITGFFARNDEDYLALIFEREGSYLGREVSCLHGPTAPA